MTTNFLDSQESDVSLLAAFVGIKSYQRGKRQVISIGHMVYINKINEVERVPFKLFYCILMTLLSQGKYAQHIDAKHCQCS